MRALKLLLIVGAVFILNNSSTAQDNKNPLTPPIKSQIIDSLSFYLLSNYVYPDTAATMVKHIKNRLNAGAYSIVNDPQKFAKLLTTDLLSVFNDGHLWVRYAPVSKNEDTLTYRQRVVAQIKLLKAINAGFIQADILPGNIGYVKLDMFSDLNEDTKETVNGAMSFVKNSDALIIDLRHNGGGNINMVLYLLGFFFKNTTHSTDFYNTNIRQLVQYRIEPHKKSGPLITIPIYVLVSNYTGSCAELFAYDLQNLGRATIVGERTKGAANAMSPVTLGNGFQVHLPYARAINSITKTSWEGIGVSPGVKVEPDKAIDAAMLSHFDSVANNSKDAANIGHAKWMHDIVSLKSNPVNINPTTLKTYAGTYGDNVKIIAEGEKLYIIDGYKQLLTPVAKNTFVFYTSKIIFIKNAKGLVTQLNVINETGITGKYMKATF